MCEGVCECVHLCVSVCTSCTCLHVSAYCVCAHARVCVQGKFCLMLHATHLCANFTQGWNFQSTHSTVFPTSMYWSVGWRCYIGPHTTDCALSVLLLCNKLTSAKLHDSANDIYPVVSFTQFIWKPVTCNNEYTAS
jgi:hypothetical protein